MWNYWTLRSVYLKAAESVGLKGVRMYEAGKHSMATEALGRTGNERAVQAFLGHSDIRSTRRYAQRQDSALVDVLRMDSGWTQAPDEGEHTK
jgi:site-specific recombinase XerD